MLYALLGSLVLNGLSVLFLLWRKSIIEAELSATQAKLVIKSSACESLILINKQDQDQLVRKDAQINTLENTNATYLEALKKSGASGVFAELLQKRNSDVSKPSA